MGKGTNPEKVVREIHRRTRRRFSAEEKIRIILDGLRGEESIAELCRREGLAPNLYYRWSKEFLGSCTPLAARTVSIHMRNRAFITLLLLAESLRCSPSSSTRSTDYAVESRAGLCRRCDEIDIHGMVGRSRGTGSYPRLCGRSAAVLRGGRTIRVPHGG